MRGLRFEWLVREIGNSVFLIILFIVQYYVSVGLGYVRHNTKNDMRSRCHQQCDLNAVSEECLYCNSQNQEVKVRNRATPRMQKIYLAS
jgi:hypothetical protein